MICVCNECIRGGLLHGISFGIQMIEKCEEIIGVAKEAIVLQ